MPRPDRFEVVIAGGRSCSIRRNPGDAFGLLLRGAPARALAGTRGLLTATDLLVWQNGTVFHDDVERATGLRGLHLVLRNADVGVSLDALDPGMGPPWLLPAGEATRREAVTAWLRANPRLAALYPEGFGIDWYEPWPGIDAEGLHAGERRPAA
ncbi:hypothetical protein [Paracraurococcus lichenis]|uniref:Uncharacterized protein n=1 Tax=Paracraurococcus lichenis TaxID=3064888 RepID=A0ABT9DUR7_9PROT|nr:hypothetical protein [Paracraurococcus sp. LOR1-02]MDO9707644.1 hypothetical protein [Paracraurococcus sp. LOR1-02]